MGISPFFTSDDRLAWEFMRNKPNPARGSWQGPSGRIYAFPDDSRDSAKALGAAQAEYSKACGDILKTCRIRFSDLGNVRISTEDF